MHPRIKGKLKAIPIAVVVEIPCPVCPETNDPIAAPDGSFLWRTGVPKEITCPRCGGTFEVSQRPVF